MEKIKGLGGLEEYLKGNNFVDTEELSASDNYGETIDVALGNASSNTEAHIFITRFSMNDVDEFIVLLRNNFPQRKQFVYKDNLAKGIESWCADHPKQCPYEPFLWALKITDKYIGSLQHNAQPQPPLLKAVGEVLKSVWDDSYLSIICHMLETWDWYQPIHVLLTLYRMLTDVNDDKIDEIIRSNWLTRAVYCTSAFECLIKKKATEENIEAIMRFVSRDEQKDSNLTDIQISNAMRKKTQEYLEDLPKDKFAFAKTVYVDKLYGSSKKARSMFDAVFIGNTSGNAEIIKDFIQFWNESTTDTKSTKAVRRLNEMLKNNDVAHEFITAVAQQNNTALTKELLKAIENKGIDFSFQFLLKEMAKNAALCPEYGTFIAENYQNLVPVNTSDRAFIFGCAYCHLGHVEVLPELFDAFYLKAVASANGRHIFSDLRLNYSKQFQAEIDRLVNDCSGNIALSEALVSSCNSIYSKKASTLYPVAFDKVCKVLLDEVVKEQGNEARYGTLLIDLYEKVATINNRDRYYEPLLLLSRTHSLMMNSVKNRAKKLIRLLFPPA